jgi:hypothetical protein
MATGISPVFLGAFTLAVMHASGTAHADLVTYRVQGEISHVFFATDRQFDEITEGTPIWIDLTFDTNATPLSSNGNITQWNFNTVQSRFHIDTHSYEPRDILGWNTFQYTNSSTQQGNNDVFQTAGEIIEKGDVGNYFITIDLDPEYVAGSGPLINPPLIESSIGPILSSQGFFTLGEETKGVSIAWEAIEFYRVPSPGVLSFVACGAAIGCRRRR